MTENVTGAENAAVGATARTATLDASATAGSQPTWISVEHPPRKKHLGLWFGIPGGFVAAAAVAASLLLIAPGVTVAGASVGLTTPGGARQAIEDRLADLTIHIGDATLTAAQLGATVDAKSLAADAHSEHPLWNVTAWNPQPSAGKVTIDPAVALPALRQAAPQLFSDATDAGVVFDTKSGKFTATAAEPGRGVDVAALATSLTDALGSPTGTALGLGAAPATASSVTLHPKQTEVDAAATTAKAQAFADKLNAQADSAGFYLQGTRAAAVSLATVASWMEIKADPTTGEFSVTPKQAAINAAVADLPAKVNKSAQNATVVTNSAGKTLRVVQQGHDGFGISSTDGVAAQIATDLTNSNLKFSLQGEVQKYTTTTVFRRLEVDKSAGMTYLYEGPKAGQEKLIATYPIAIGKPGHDTRDGHYTVYTQLPTQDMGNCDGKHPQFDYCTKNVPWISYFDGDQGFHGTYWHNNFGPGARMSHGCVNMRIADALTVYKFAQVGTEVWVHE